MRNGVVYSGSFGVTETRVNELITSALTGIIKKVALPETEYTVPANNCKDVFIKYSDVVPTGYTPIGITDIDFGLNQQVYLGIKRLHPRFDSNYTCVAVSNNTSSSVTATMLVRIICVKSDMLNYI